MLRPLLLGLLLPFPLFPQYPLIQQTKVYKDNIYRQQQKEVEAWYYNEVRELPAPPLSIYRYNPQQGETLVILASLFNLNMETIATLNGIENITDLKGGKELLIPSSPGIFIDKESQSSWFSSLRKILEPQNKQSLVLFIQGERRRVEYFPGARLPREHMQEFIEKRFSSPLAARTITSPFGFRNHPVSKVWSFHRGTDYRAPLGTAVFSPADGEISRTGELADYGIYVIVRHNGGYTTMYAHLNRVVVKKGDFVRRGDKIAETGNTGISTGPHLHFEVHKGGRPLDPEDLIRAQP